MEGALSVFMGALTPDLVLVVVFLFACVRGGIRAVFLAFGAGLMLDLRWEPVVGLSSVYLTVAAYLIDLFYHSPRFKSHGLKHAGVFLLLMLFYLFKFSFYSLLNVEYDVSYPVLLGRIVIDMLLFGIGTIVIGRGRSVTI